MSAADGQALLWTPWAMEGRDPQRSGRSPTVGVEQPRLVWSTPIDPPSFAQPVFARDGTLYVGTVAGLTAVGGDGRVRWTYAVPGPVPTPAVGPDDTVYLRGGDGALYALHPDGQRAWTSDIGAPPLRLGPAPIVGPDRYLYLASYQSTLVYLVQPGGFFQWAYNARARVPAAVAVGLDGTIYVGTADGKLRALDREMNETWSAELGGPAASAPAVGPDGAVYLLVGDGRPGLAAFDGQGRRRWSAGACWSEGAPVQWPAVAADGRLQIGDCALASNGSVAWRTPSTGPTTPAVVDADGNAYFASGAVVTALRSDGTARWAYRAEGEVGPPSLGPFGAVAFSSRSPDRLYLLAR